MRPETVLLLGGGVFVGLIAAAMSAPTSVPVQGSGSPPVGTLPPHAPIPGSLPLRLSSRYGWRTDPVYGGQKFHAGIDLPVPVGTPVFAPLPGLVVRVDRVGDGEREANGNAVFLAVGGWRWCFLHLSAVQVQVGQTVARGQQLARSGNTGKSTGPHLHIQVYDRAGNTLDPARLYPDGMFR